MAEAESTNEGTPSENFFSSPNKKQGGSSMLKKGIAIGVLIFVSILSLSVFGFFNFDPGSPTPSAMAAGSVNCADWALAGPGYKKAIENAANMVGIQPALLGAIFLSEHGNEWPQKEMNDSWNSGGNGIGPFQIEEWDKKWTAYIKRVADERGYTPPSNPRKDDPNIKPNFDDSALLAGSFLRVLAKSEVGDIDPMTTNENEIKCLAAAYNGGPDMCKNWRNKNYEGDPPTTDRYHIRVWESFRELNVDCKSLAPSELAQKIIAIARVEAGLTTSGGKYNPPKTGYKPAKENCAIKYGGGCPQQWNAIFLSWVYKQAGRDIGMLDSAEKVRNYFDTKSAYDSSPSPEEINKGDVLVLKGNGNANETNLGVTYRVGIVTKINGKTITIIHGNTQGDDVQSQDYNIDKVLGVGKLNQLSNQ